MRQVAAGVRLKGPQVCLQAGAVAVADFRVLGLKLGGWRLCVFNWVRGIAFEADFGNVVEILVLPTNAEARWLAELHSLMLIDGFGCRFRLYKGGKMGGETWLQKGRRGRR
ncbi:MAG: hypothetical protein ACKERG_03815 [Candidatus Hodgkinia cicadicola]